MGFHRRSGAYECCFRRNNCCSTLWRECDGCGHFVARVHEECEWAEPSGHSLHSQRGVKTAVQCNAVLRRQLLSQQLGRSVRLWARGVFRRIFVYLLVQRFSQSAEYFRNLDGRQTELRMHQLHSRSGVLREAGGDFGLKVPTCLAASFPQGVQAH